MKDLERALKTVEGFSSGQNLTKRISHFESELLMKDSSTLKNILADEGVSDSVIQAALRIKQVAGQINVTIHAVGILISLPYILEPGEKIRSLSLGAGNTGKRFDLETDRRVAEFKFIQWRGGPEASRQNEVFIDLFNLVARESSRKRYLYVVGKEQPLRFLNNNRFIKSVLSKNRAVSDEFHGKYGDKYSVVSQYYNEVKHLVKIIDLKEVVPAFTQG